MGVRSPGLNAPTEIGDNRPDELGVRELGNVVSVQVRKRHAVRVLVSAVQSNLSMHQDVDGRARRVRDSGLRLSQLAPEYIAVSAASPSLTM